MNTLSGIGSKKLMIPKHKEKLVLTFNKATPEDLNFLLELRKLSMTEHLLAAGLDYDDEQHKARILEYYNDTYLLNLADKAIGVVKLGQMADRWHIRQFQILPDYHGKGVGTKVLSLLQSKAQSVNMPITLNVLYQNPARRLYERMGFKVIGENGLEYQMRWSL